LGELLLRWVTGVELRLALTTHLDEGYLVKVALRGYVRGVLLAAGIAQFKRRRRTLTTNLAEVADFACDE
jgi:hypothetical protein